MVPKGTGVKALIFAWKPRPSLINDDRVWYMYCKEAPVRQYNQGNLWSSVEWLWQHYTKHCPHTFTQCRARGPQINNFSVTHRKWRNGRAVACRLSRCAVCTDETSICRQERCQLTHFCIRKWKAFRRLSLPTRWHDLGGAGVVEGLVDSGVRQSTPTCGDRATGNVEMRPSWEADSCSANHEFHSILWKPSFH